MVEASKDLVCVFVDCDWGKKNQDLSRDYGVRGYPTVIFCDPEGKALEPLRGRDPASVAAQMRKIAARFNGEAADPLPPPLPDFGPRALEAARQASKPLIVYFYDDSPASGSVHQSLADPLVKGALSRVLLTKALLKRGDPLSAKYAVTRAPTLLLLDAAADKPLTRIEGSRSARELLRDLDAALGGPPSPAADAPRPAPRPIVTKEDEALSDDEVDRQFIQAQLVVAREWLRKDRKAKAIEILEDILRTYPRHVAATDARKLLESIPK